MIFHIIRIGANSKGESARKANFFPQRGRAGGWDMNQKAVDVTGKGIKFNILFSFNFFQQVNSFSIHDILLTLGMVEFGGVLKSFRGVFQNAFEGFVTDVVMRQSRGQRK